MKRLALRVACTAALFVFGAAGEPGVRADVPLAEHPRPIFQRDPWLNLNGTWAFDFDPEDAGDAERWYEEGRHEYSRRIVVPFPWESELSGVHDTEYKGVAWYSRSVQIPEEWRGKRVWLCFSAVDWKANVWVNGQPVAEHVGGYTPFACDITRAAGPGDEARIVVRAEDLTAPDQPTGKQTGWYTRTSGIWQTVRLEPRATTFLERVEVVVDVARENTGARVRVKAMLGGEQRGTVEATLGDREFLFAPMATDGVLVGSVKLDSPRLWSPEDPFLYDVEYRVLDQGRVIDRVSSYVGVRQVTTAKAEGRDYRYIFLNGKPVYLRGALHQSFHPEGIYQYPDDATLRLDYEYAKKIGLNFFRIHIKSEIPRALYWADKLGVLIMEDQPNFSAYSETSRKNWELVLRETVKRDFNNPSIFAWCNFNETWGIGRGGYSRERQLWVKDMYELTKTLDLTRLVEDNSPCRYDHVVTDVNSWHFYINDYARAREHIANVVAETQPGSRFNYAEGFRQDDAPLINSEYGGISAGLGDQDISWCFKYLTNELRKHDKICGYVYTEQSDIEWEHNGFLNYDRTEKVFGYDSWFPGFGLRDLNSADFVVLDAHPCPRLEPGETSAVPVLVSHWSAREAEATLRWSVDWIDRWGSRHRRVASGTRAAPWEQYRVVPAGTIEVEAPDEGPAVGVLQVSLVGRDEKRLAANYVNFLVDSPSPRVEVLDERRIALRFAPRDVAAFEWTEGELPVGGSQGGKVAGRGSGYTEYRISLPPRVPSDGLAAVECVLEASAKAGDEKLSWPARKKPVDYPQTDKEVAWPSDLVVSLAGERVLETTLADDPADARGVLSHLRRHHPGSYGYLVRARLEGTERPEALERLRAKRKLTVRLEVPRGAERRGGLAVFGEKLGRYPLDPTLILQYGGGHGLPATLRSDTPVAVERLVVSRVELVPTAESAPGVWDYTTEKPGASWKEPDFEASGWKEGRSGFGRPGTPGAIIHTEWETEEIWLRRVFEVDDPDDIRALGIRMHHDEDVDVWLNGTHVAGARGFVRTYGDAALGPEATRLLRPGKNVLAVRCRQTQGGQFVDVGLFAVRKAERRGPS